MGRQGRWLSVAVLLSSSTLASAAPRVGPLDLPSQLVAGVLQRALAASVGLPSTSRVSVDSAHGQADRESLLPQLSADGRYVAFSSDADNLVCCDGNGMSDVFVHDRLTGQTTRVSVDSAGREANGPSAAGGISADGRCVAFHSAATNLTPGGNDGTWQVFVHDRQTGKTICVSVNSEGKAGNRQSGGERLSGDGRYVAFGSAAGNLVLGDTNGKEDIFVHDRLTRRTTRVSPDFTEPDAMCGVLPSLSADGRYVVFYAGVFHKGYNVFVHDRRTGQTTSVAYVPCKWTGPPFMVVMRPQLSADGRWVAFIYATDLDPDPGVDKWLSLIYVHDRQTGQTTCASVGVAGDQANGGSGWPSLSADGRYVGFISSATNLVPGDANGTADIFVRDLQAKRTTLVSVDVWGRQANGGSAWPAVSADGRYVAFDSEATNLVPDDTNGCRDIFVRDLKTFRIGGKVTLPGQKDCRGLTVTANPGRLTAIVQADGTYAIDGLGAGAYTVAPSREGWEFTARKVTVPPPAEHVDFTGTALKYEVSGRVTQAGAKPMGGVKVTVSPGGRWDLTNADGRYQITRLTPGTYTVSLSRSGWLFGRRLVTVPPSRTGINFRAVKKSQAAGMVTALSAVPSRGGAQISFSLSGPGSLSTRVLNLAGRPVRTLCADRDCPEGASALLWDARSDLGLAVPNGTYVIELTAKCADGSQARGVAPLRLAR